MLRAIYKCDEEATTTEIRNVTGLSNSQVAYRREKLQEYGLIAVQTGEPIGSRTPPKSHSLTASARSHIDDGLFDRYNVPVTSDVEQLSTQVNHLRDRVDDLAETVEHLDESIENLNADLNARVGNQVEIQKATEGEKMANVVSTIQNDLESLREEVSELEERKRNKLLR